MKLFERLYSRIVRPDAWARPKMYVTFRAEIMPGTAREERTYQIKEVLSNGRVVLADFPGEHRETQFEPLNLNREITGEGR